MLTAARGYGSQEVEDNFARGLELRLRLRDDEGLAIARRTGDHFFLAENYRLQGDITLVQTGPAAAAEVEALFKRSLQVARTQGARSWEPRTATSLARLWCDLGRHEEAAELLLPIVRSLKEGLLTPDVTEAIALANELKAVTS